MKETGTFVTFGCIQACPGVPKHKQVVKLLDRLKSQGEKLEIPLIVILFLAVEVEVFIFLTAAWLPHGQLWATVEGTVSLTRS